MGHVFFGGGKVGMEAPVGDLLLSTITEGSTVKLSENGIPVEFYVAKHDYESALNGKGRTLLVRKDCYNTRLWHTPNINAYASSAIDSWLNSSYKALLDTGTQEHLSTTKFYYTPGNGNTKVGTLSRSIFLLSLTELGESNDYVNIEGSVLPIASTLRIAYLNGSTSAQWTRSPATEDVRNVCLIHANGNMGSSGCSSTYGSRPALTLPSNALFDKETLLFKEVA